MVVKVIKRKLAVFNLAEQLISNPLKKIIMKKKYAKCLNFTKIKFSFFINLLAFT